MIVTQTVTDVCDRLFEMGVLVDKVPVHRIVLNDVVGDEVGNR
ncbi:Uncharacterised protein [Vibrio cholerae]|nr:Uncharacterised protein [Vibrio cholerae]CSC61170.1 Uncharacterised protein [Vibrio cholerae]CSC87234.1 Uncharacterised protein [Vibrio cholerae]CSD31055.1 Uncharacterised protein [Vibrio cholerae]CSI21895.1 Uncharacterised protein [Vibrio cholerae]